MCESTNKSIQGGFCVFKVELRNKLIYEGYNIGSFSGLCTFRYTNEMQSLQLYGGGHNIKV